MKKRTNELLSELNNAKCQQSDSQKKVVGKANRIKENLLKEISAGSKRDVILYAEFRKSLSF